MAQRLSEMGDIAVSILDAIPSPIFLVDDDVQILGYNLAASQMLAQDPEMVIRHRAGEILHCLHATETTAGCGRSKACQDCLVRNSVYESLLGRRAVRRKIKMELVQEGHPREIYLLVTTAPFNYQGNSLALLILEDISELMEIKSILPICAHCKKIRNDQEYWQSLEKYFKEHLDQEFSHSICPDCAQKFYPEFVKDKDGSSS
jgi:PAS domain-containing protein